MTFFLPYAVTAMRLQSARLRAARSRDDGVISMELAIAAFILGGLALTVLGIIVYKAVSRANAIPDE